MTNDAEEARLAELHSLAIMDTEPEGPFEDAVNLAAAICGTPISLITLLDGKRQWFKARVGLAASETPQEQAFCGHAIRGRDLFIVSDAQKDARFVDNPLVTGDPNIRFYAGAPLLTPQGHALGTLCVIDTVPRQLTSSQKTALGLLSKQVYKQMRLRNQIKGMRETLTETHRFQTKLSGINALFEAYMDNSPIISFMKDSAGRFIYYNRLFAERFSITRDEWIDKSVFDIFPREFAEGYCAVDQAVLNSGGPIIIEETSPAPDGSTISWRTCKFPFNDVSGTRILAGASLDITGIKKAESELRHSHEELHKVNQRLRELTVTDALTGLANRRGFDERLSREFNLAIRYNSDFSLLMLDIDDFKTFNDSFGHDEGDHILRTFSNTLLSGARTTDSVCRYGGEEFAVLLPNTDMASARSIAERVRESIETAPWELRPITVSIGVAPIGSGIPDAATLVHRADLALYAAKTRGKNCVVSYSPNLDQHGSEIHVGHSLRKAS